MAEQIPPKIEFPCDYPIKVLGESSDDFREHVITVFEQHAPGFDAAQVVMRDSRNGNFQSVTIVIQATGVTQLEKIFDELKVCPTVRMVL